jgi:hypothetical protein
MGSGLSPSHQPPPLPLPFIITLRGNGVTNTNLLKADKNVELNGNVVSRGMIEAGQDVLVSGRNKWGTNGDRPGVRRRVRRS